MRILVVIYEFPPIGGGGGRAAYDICKDLVSRGHQVMVLTAHMRGLPLEETRDGIQLMRIRSLRAEAFRASFMTMLSYVLAGLWPGLRLIWRHRPEIIHTHFAVPSGALAWLLSVLSGVPYVLTAHLGDVPDGVPEKTGRWFRWIKPLTYPIWKRAKRIVAVSEYTRQLALKHYPVTVSVIPNGADVKLLAPSAIKLNHPPRLVFAGRFVPQKNPLAIVRILFELQDLEWNCAMLGDGPLLNDVKRELEGYGMQHRFDLPGWVTPDEVLDCFTRSDILFMPSLSEGLPVVGVQALAKGLALVVSRIGGFADLVDDGRNGYLIEPQDKGGFKNVLRKLLTDETVLFGCRSASLQKAPFFDVARIAGQYEEAFRSVIEEFN